MRREDTRRGLIVVLYSYCSRSSTHSRDSEALFEYLDTIHRASASVLVQYSAVQSIDSGGAIRLNPNRIPQLRSAPH